MRSAEEEQHPVLAAMEQAILDLLEEFEHAASRRQIFAP